MIPPAPFTIVRDDREKRPLAFPARWPVQVRRLETADYTIAGHETEIGIERKSIEDLFTSATRGRERLERELERLAAFRYGAVVVECDLADVLAGLPDRLVSPRSVIGSLVAWSVRYRLAVWFARGRKHAAALTLKALSKFYKYAVAEPAGMRGRSKL